MLKTKSNNNFVSIDNMQDIKDKIVDTCEIINSNIMKRRAKKAVKQLVLEVN